MEKRTTLENLELKSSSSSSDEANHHHHQHYNPYYLALAYKFHEHCFQRSNRREQTVQSSFFSNESSFGVLLNETMAINEEALSSSGTAATAAAATAKMSEDAAEKGFNLEEIRRKKQSPVAEQTSPVGDAKTAPQNEQKQRVVNNRRRTLVARLQNWVDFNLKFKSPDLERIYERSYLSVTRFLFVRYLIYLSVFTLTWLVYLLVIGCFFDRSSCHATSQLNGYLQPVEESTGSEWTYRVVYQSSMSSANATNTNNGSSGHNLPLFIYMAFMATIYVFIFVFVLFIELNERAYRSLKERLDQKELETKVDVNIAVGDLKKAMQQVLIKEAEYKSLKENVDLKFIDIDKMRTMYARVSYALALVVVSLMFLLCFLMFCVGGSSDLSTSQGVITQVSHFIWFCEMLMLFYLIYPFDMLISVGLGIVASLVFEVLALQRQIDGTATLNTAGPAAAADDDDDHHQFNSVYLQSQLIIFVFVKILLHSSLHAIALYLKVSLQAIKRDTFLKIAHMHKAHLAAQTDKEITERMIKSIMPPLFTHVFGRPEDFKMSVARVHRMRPLFIYPVNQISILFADIVGFTRMSSKKTAEELVFLLNDLYGRFDRLCEKAGCEKISTLGDCYYCVSGCLNGRDDHAKCCVEMGLLMVKEIEMFNKCHNVDVNMRVGVHTGNALAGFIGGKRFRFDVWSSDVTIANKMESTGLPGRVHISEDTYKHLEGKFRTEPGEKYSGKGTYFVMQESKRETVADTLRFYESASVENSALKPLDQVNEQQQYTETSSFIKSGQSAGQQTAKDETATSGEVAKAAESSGDAEADEDELLFLAIKDAHFIQPSLNPITMRFKTSEEESKFQAYLMGMNTQLLTTPTSQSTYSTHHQVAAPPPPSQSYHQHHRHSSKFSNSLRIWAHPQNTLFVSFLLAVCVNLCLSTAYFLTFIVSSMSAYEYKLTDAYSSDFLLVLVFFGILCLVQFGFLLVNFWTCNRAMKKRQRFNNAPISGVHPSNSMATTEFSENLINNNANNHASKPSSIGDLESGNTRRFVPSAKPGGGPMSTHFLVSMSHQNQKRRRRRILINFSLLHLVSFVLLSLVPVYILTTALPSALPNMLSSSWSSIVSAANHSTSDSATKTTTTAAATIASTKRLNLFAMYSYFCYTIALIHFCSFVQLSALFKSLLALAFAATFSIISFLGVCTSYNEYQSKSFDSLSNSTTTTTKVTSVLSRALLGGQPATIPFSFYTTQFVKGFISANAPILIDAALLVILIFLVNRHLEVTQRLSFRNDKTAQLKVAYAREQKELASWLIEVVLPAHVVSHVKEKKQYSRNYDCVGVLFVSLCNFSEFFEETFEGGRELLRVLNEITVDFDGLLDEPKYKNVEKIKSIGSTFMIASGLGADLDTDASTAAVVNNDAHLHELIEFALELYEKLETFNNEAMSVCHFKFQMRMGFNCGPVTAGVIGTERLLYDIWGDTVNVASRMDSTGQAGSIQCPERVAKSLANDYNFRERGAIQIKGKDQMVTYFMDPKENAPKRLN